MSESLQHIGIIMDGNRRWAKLNGKSSLQGHKAGYDNFYRQGRYLLKDKKVPFVSGYVFSTENWDRTQTEVNYLMRLVTKALNEFLYEFHTDGIKIVVLGNKERLSKTVTSAIIKAEETTKNNKNGTLALCFNYGGQQELVDSFKNLTGKKVRVQDITAELITENLYKPELPPVDLIIRTSGEMRLSGFMLWRSMYSELYFNNKHWPDFNNNDLDAALVEYTKRQRRFGK